MRYTWRRTTQLERVREPVTRGEEPTDRDEGMVERAVKGREAAEAFWQRERRVSFSKEGGHEELE